MVLLRLFIEYGNSSSPLPDLPLVLPCPEVFMLFSGSAGIPGYSTVAELEIHQAVGSIGKSPSNLAHQNGLYILFVSIADRLCPISLT